MADLTGFRPCPTDDARTVGNGRVHIHGRGDVITDRVTGCTYYNGVRSIGTEQAETILRHHVQDSFGDPPLFCQVMITERLCDGVGIVCIASVIVSYLTVFVAILRICVIGVLREVFLRYIKVILLVESVQFL